MDDTAQEIRETHEQGGETNETPDLAGGDGDGGDDGDVGGGGGLSSLPIPSLSKKHVAIIGAVVLAIVAWKLYQSRSGSSGGEGSLLEGREKLEKGHKVEAKPEEQEHEPIEVTRDPNNPLQADSDVINALRKNGTITDPEDNE